MNYIATLKLVTARLQSLWHINITLLLYKAIFLNDNNVNIYVITLIFIAEYKELHLYSSYIIYVTDNILLIFMKNIVNEL